jgi:hypothetical protein
VALPGAYAPTSIALLIIGASKLRLHNKSVVLEKDEGIQEKNNVRVQIFEIFTNARSNEYRGRNMA